MTIPLQFASLYDGQVVFMWSDCVGTSLTYNSSAVWGSLRGRLHVGLHVGISVTSSVHMTRWLHWAAWPSLFSLSLALFARQNHGLEQSARGLWLCLLPPGHQFLSSPASPNPFSTTSFPTPTLPAVHPLNKSAIFFRLIDQLTVALEKKKYKIGCRGRQPPL